MRRKSVPMLRSDILSKYCFMNGDKLLFEFQHEHTVKGNHYILGDLQEDIRTLPLSFSASGYNEGSMYAWVETRVAPVGRHHMEAILGAVNLQNRFDVLIYCHGLSLNDTFWVRGANEKATFSDINLYDNPFDEALGWIAFTGLPSNISRNLSTPEFTTEGALPKFWQKINGKDILLCKGGTSGYANAGGEPFSEAIASLIADYIGIYVIQYKMEVRNNKPVSVSKLFTSKEYGLITMNEILKCYFPNRLKISFEECEILIKSLLGTVEPLYDMCFFDWLIKNEDRHLNNWGFTVNNKTREIVSFSPIWDNGMSLLWSAMKPDFPKAYEYNNLFSSFNIPYDFVLDCPFRKKYIKMCNKLLQFIQNGKFKKECQEIFNGYEKHSWKIPYIEESLQRRCYQYINLEIDSKRLNKS